MQAYCFKCKGKIEILSPIKVRTKSGGLRVKGFCPRCKTQVSVFTNPKKSGGVLAQEI